MPSFNSVLLATTLAGIALGSPLQPGNFKVGTTALHKESGRFTVKQRARSNYVFNPAMSVYKTYLKFGVEPPELLKIAVANLRKRTTGNVSANPIDEFDSAYVSPVQIGTPPQTLDLDFDTGSSDLWVFSSQTPPDQVNGQSIYTTTSSSTAQEVADASWSITYGDGSASAGVVYTDVVEIGGVSVPNQGVEVATTVSGSFSSEPAIHGLLGLGFDSLNTVEPTAQKTFFSNAISQLDAPLFTADLKFKAPGTYNFGFIDDTAYTGNITYTAVNTNPGYWLFSSTGYGVGSTFTAGNITGIADTGTTLLYLPDTIVRAYYAQVQGAQNSPSVGGYIFPCTATLPSFTFGIGAARITIPSEVLNYAEATPNQCFGGLQSSSGIGINIFGDIALKAAFVVFDGATPPRLGWAAKPL